MFTENGIVVVTGPQGCGKTRNRKAIADFFQCPQVFDEESRLCLSGSRAKIQEHLNYCLPPTGRILVLSCFPGTLELIKTYCADRFDAHYTFEEAMNKVRGWAEIGEYQFPPMPPKAFISEIHSANEHRHENISFKTQSLVGVIDHILALERQVEEYQQADELRLIIQMMQKGDSHGLKLFGELIKRGLEKANIATFKFPQPNYTLIKFSEESGEFVKEAVHYAEGRGQWKLVVNELIDVMAMLIRLVTEGDGVIGFRPPYLPDLKKAMTTPPKISGDDNLPRDTHVFRKD